MLIPPNCAYVNVQYSLPTLRERAALNLRSNSGVESCRNDRNRRRKAIRERQQSIKIAVRVMFYLKAARIRSERTRAHTLPLRLSNLIHSACCHVFTLHLSIHFVSSLNNWLVVLLCICQRQNRGKAYTLCLTQSTAFAYTLPLQSCLDSTEHLCSIRVRPVENL